MPSKATTVAQYLRELPAEPRAALEAVREVIRANLDDDYEEGMQYGMIGYYVPHRVYPAGYHCDPKQPLPFAGLASQKNHMSLYIMSLYGEGEPLQRFRAAWAQTGRKLDMGKACIRFKRLDDLPLDVIGDTIRQMPARKYIAQYKATLGALRKEPARNAQQAQSAKSPRRTATAKKSKTAPVRSGTRAPRAKAGTGRTRTPRKAAAGNQAGAAPTGQKATTGRDSRAASRSAGK